MLKLLSGMLSSLNCQTLEQNSIKWVPVLNFGERQCFYGLVFVDDCGALESVKAASELFCPVTGVVTEKNKEVEDTPGLINQSPYEEGWLFKMEITKPEELTSLLDEAGYEKHLKDQDH